MAAMDSDFEGFVPNDVRETREVESDLEIDSIIWMCRLCSVCVCLCLCVCV